jgi:hypothetical protein
MPYYDVSNKSGAQSSALLTAIITRKVTWLLALVASALERGTTTTTATSIGAAISKAVSDSSCFSFLSLLFGAQLLLLFTHSLLATHPRSDIAQMIIDD